MRVSLKNSLRLFLETLLLFFSWCKGFKSLRYMLLEYNPSPRTPNPLFF